MPPRKKQCKNSAAAGIPSTSRGLVNTSLNRRCALPWPREDLFPFPLDRLPERVQNANKLSQLDTLPIRELGEAWNDRNSVLYNKWLRVRFHPTPRLFEPFLGPIGLYDSITDILRAMGLGNLPRARLPVYPELCAEFFSSISFHHFDQADLRDGRQYFIAFMLRGLEYRLSVPQICGLFGFDRSKSGTEFPASDSMFIWDLWRAIGDPTATETSEMRLSTVRNPTIRILLKIIGIVFFGREETGTATSEDMAMLYYSLPDSALSGIHPAVRDDAPDTLEVNLGYVFAKMLYRRRTRGLTVTVRGKDDYLGGLLGPIFREVGVDLALEETVDDREAHFDLAYFKRARMFIEYDVYRFEVEANKPLSVTLPLPELAIPDSPAALAFQVPEDRLHGYECPPSERTSFSRPSAGPSRSDFSEALLRQFPPLPGAPEWEPIPDGDKKARRRAKDNIKEKMFRMLAAGFGCRCRHSVETAGEPSRRAPTPRAEHEDVEDAAAAEAQHGAVYHRGERGVFPSFSYQDDESADDPTQ